MVLLRGRGASGRVAEGEAVTVRDLQRERAVSVNNGDALTVEAHIRGLDR